MKRELKKVYVAPQCKVIETCVEQLLTGSISIGGGVNQPEHGGSFAKENPWTFDETESFEESSNDFYFNE